MGKNSRLGSNTGGKPYDSWSKMDKRESSVTKLKGTVNSEK